MPMVPFPTPNATSADLARAVAAVRPLALATRFRGRPADAARWALTASPDEADMALAADSTLALARLRRALRRALRAGDLDTAHHLRPAVARLQASITEVARKHRVRGWHTAALVVLTLLASAPVPVLASECDSIRNSDRRAACEGRTRSASDCEAIRNADRRAACRAEAHR